MKALTIKMLVGVAGNLVAWKVSGVNLYLYGAITFAACLLGALAFRWVWRTYREALEIQARIDARDK